MSLLNSLETGTGLTDNGAITNISSLNECLDFFFLSGASRTMSEKDIVSMFSKAISNDRNTALKILFYARDVRGGAGERRLFRVLLKYLIHNHPDIYSKILEYIPVYGRWDDTFFDIDIVNHSMDYLKTEINKLEDGLLFKWLPRQKSSNKEVANFIMSRLKMSPKQYRQMLAENSITVENQMCDKEWKAIEYNKVPSRAFKIYADAFKRHDETRFTEFLTNVEDGKQTINAGAIFPVDIYKSFLNEKDIKSVNAQWSQLPDYMNDENVLAVCDTSGSMRTNREGETIPMDVSVSLGVYISERSKGIFKDCFITFESKPKLQKLSGKTTDRFRQISTANSDCGTNLIGVFDLILKVALRDGLKQSDMPTKIIIISDMEFNNTGFRGNFETIDERYNLSGYKRPTLIFWNVNGRLGNVPVQTKDRNVALVSGYATNILTSILGGSDLTPVGVMNKALEKYSFIDNIK